MNGLGLKSYKQTLYIIMNIFTITSLYYFSNAALVCAKHPSSTAQEIGRCYYYPHFTDEKTESKRLREMPVLWSTVTPLALMTAISGLLSLVNF